MWHIYIGGAREGGGFQSNSESMLWNALVDANQPFICKAYFLHMQQEPISLQPISLHHLEFNDRIGHLCRTDSNSYHLHEHHSKMCVRRSMYSTLWVTTLTSPALFVIFLCFVFKSVCTLVWAIPTFPVDTSGVNRFQTSGTLLLRFVVSSRMVTLSDLCWFPPQWAVLLHPCWQADLFALWTGYGWGIRGSTQANTFLCPTLKWLSSDINFLSLLDSVREHCSLQMRCTHSIFPFPGVNTINNSYILTGMVSARSAEVSEILI